ncbi:MAG: hypothetical protein PHU23_00145 [Dehalococcoidales bacterium]|jgi:hypothetical protein|nr:hypothetical protein [Dehalococcoidales bacterium]
MRQDMMLRAFKAAEAMEPIALLDDFVKIISYQSTRYRKVDFYESIPPHQVWDTQAATPNGPLAAAAALAANTTGALSAVTNFDLNDDEFGQWRWFPYDNAEIYLFLPSGVGKFQLKNRQIPVTKSIIYRDPLLVSTEFNSWEDERPSVRPVNFSGYAMTAIRIIALGFRFHTVAVDKATEDKLATGQLPCTPIQCAGHA